jgi:hypothetical protein
MKLHGKDLHNLHSSQNIISVMKSRRIRWVKNVARMEAMKMNTTF